MSTAPPHTTTPARARSERPRRLGWERILAVLSICVPIPLFAVTGLSIPLPAGVERIGAALVAWADDEASASPLAKSGAIVPDGSEQAAPDRRDNGGETLHRSAPAPEAGNTQADGASAGPRTTKEKDGSGGGTGGNGGSGSSGGGNGGGSGPPDPGGEDPKDDPGLIEGTVKEVTETTDPVVDEVEDTLDDVLPTDDLLPGLGG